MNKIDKILTLVEQSFQSEKTRQTNKKPQNATTMSNWNKQTKPVMKWTVMYMKEKYNKMGKEDSWILDMW